MIHLKKVNLLRPNIVNLFRNISPVLFHVPAKKKLPPTNKRLTGINPTNALDSLKAPFKYDFVANILLQYVNSQSVPWDEVTKRLHDERVKNSSEQNQLQAVYSMILQTCIELKSDTIGISFCNYLVKENRNLSMFNVFLIIKLLHEYGEKVAEHKELLKVLLNEIKPYLSSNFAYANLCAKVLCYDYDCWKDLINSFSSFKNIRPETLNILVSEAFKFNEYETGCKIWDSNLFALSQSTFVSYLNYCIREAEKGKFSISLIDNLIEKCQKSFSVMDAIGISSLFQTLVSTLNSDPNKTHVWEIYETEVTNYNVCKNCNEKLDSVKITEEEFVKLRDHVLSDVLINRNIHIKTSHEELHKFLLYLKRVKYDVVLDGLNIVHKKPKKMGIDAKGDIMFDLINHFKKRKMKMLFIGRTYVKKFSFFKYIQENCEVFFVHSLSDDDVFVMYATLYGGINTYFFTSDYLRGYQLLLNDEEMKLVFKKWNITHRYSFLPHSLRVTKPKVHSFLPQKTTIKKKLQKEGEMCWHFPLGCNSTKKMYDGSVIWYCLWRKSLNRK